jgi:Tol biopolymer transport system component
MRRIHKNVGVAVVLALSACMGDETPRLTAPKNPAPTSASASVAGQPGYPLTWTLLAPTSAYPGGNPAGVSASTYAPSRDAVFFAEAPDYGVGQLARFDLASNSWTLIPTTGWPIGKFRRVVHDPVNGRILTYWDGIGEVWAVNENGGAWQMIGGQPNSDQYYEAGAFWDPVRRQLAVFAGYGFFRTKNTLHEFAPSSGQWSILPATGAAPWPRIGPMVSTDASKGRLFIAGGEGSPSGDQFDPQARILDDFWVLNLNTLRWRNLIPLGAGGLIRSGGAIAYVGSETLVYRFGGADGKPGTYHNDLYRAPIGDGTTSFAPVVTQGVPPSPRAGSGLYFDEPRNRLILVGGFDGWRWHPEVWTLGEPSYRLDGLAIAFMSDRTGSNEIYVMNSDGSGLMRLTNDSNDDLHPAWSPDRTKIAWYSTRAGNTDIYVMNADGSNVRRLTDAPDPDAHPAWSPDGKQIAFQCVTNSQYDICMVNADGSNLRKITDTPWHEFDPIWAPNGARLAFDSFQSGSQQIWVMNVDGSAPVQLTGVGVNRTPAWSPDGYKIAFTSTRDGNDEIYVMSVDGGEARRLTTDPADDDHVSWAPDSKSLIFTSNRGGGAYQLYAMDRVGAGVTRVAISSGNDRAPAISR